MDETGRDEIALGEEPSVTPAFGVGDDGDALVDGRDDELTGDDALAPSEAFQTLASEVRVAVLVELLSAEGSGEGPLSFSELQSAAGADSSAGFAYHLRQLSDHFVSQGEDGYGLTPAGRRAAEAVVAGTFTGGDRNQAS